LDEGNSRPISDRNRPDAHRPAYDADQYM
jgi:hypothetical protein